MNKYRFDRLAAAEQHAAATGYQGARFPWESALDGTEQIPPPVSVNSEGLYEQHITADIALAQWQYYLATGDKRWLPQQGWPVISQAAAFWASRVTLGADGRYHIDGVTGPDEENPNVDDEAYTNVAAKTTLQDAAAAARVLGVGRAGLMGAIAARTWWCRATAAAMHPEFAGYGGQLVKQADVTLLQYPWAYPMSRAVAQDDINYYVPRTDPGGPSMSDAINSIDTAALGTPGCASYVYTRAQRRAVHHGRVRPVLRDPDRRRVHVHDRDRRLPAGVPLRLLRAALELRRTSRLTQASPDSSAGSCCTICSGAAARSPSRSASRRRPSR